MQTLRKIATALALATIALAAQAQVDKPVRLLVGFAPGGSADIAARLIADRMKDELKQPVLVENRPGAGGRIMGDQVTAGIDTTAEQIELHRTGKIRILGTSGGTRSPLLPEVPTFVESGLAGVEGTAWFAVYAPAKTPDATVRQLNAAINKALAVPEVRERLNKLGLESSGGTPAELSKRMADDTARWAPIVKATGFRAD